MLYKTFVKPSEMVNILTQTKQNKRKRSNETWQLGLIKKQNFNGLIIQIHQKIQDFRWLNNYKACFSSKHAFLKLFLTEKENTTTDTNNIVKKRKFFKIKILHEHFERVITFH